jgi:hypothetical protein
MPNPLPTKPGINGANVLSIPAEWDATWFRHFINNSLKGADVRNAIAGTGITITGNISSPYATISATGGGGAVTQIVAGAGISVSPAGGTGTVTVNNTGVTQIVAGTNVTISPVGGTGAVTVNAAGSAGPAIPGTIPDLRFWFESDNILGTSGVEVQALQERTPWITGICANNTTNNPNKVTIDPVQINGLTVLKWPAATISGVYPLQNPFTLTNATFFIVIKGVSSAATQAILGANTGSALALYLVSVAGTPRIGLVKSSTAVIGSSSASWIAGTAFQANVTYVGATGAFVFRQSRAAAGSGTGATAAGATTLGFIGADVGSSSLLNACSIAAIIVYERVLSGAEITAVENYLFAKWGV